MRGHTMRRAWRVEKIGRMRVRASSKNAVSRCAPAAAAGRRRARRLPHATMMGLLVSSAWVHRRAKLGPFRMMITRLIFFH